MVDPKDKTFPVDVIGETLWSNKDIVLQSQPTEEEKQTYKDKLLNPDPEIFKKQFLGAWVDWSEPEPPAPPPPKPTRDYPKPPPIRWVYD